MGARRGDPSHRASHGWKRFRQRASALLLAAAASLAACSGDEDGAGSTTTGAPPAAPAGDEPGGPGPATTPAATPAPAPTADVDLPAVVAVAPGATTVAAYGRLDLAVELDVDPDANPFDQRAVALDAVFTAPSGERFAVPGFWDGDDAWTVRFTPDAPGRWGYELTVTDVRGTSDPSGGAFDVTPSDHPGFIRVGADVDPTYSTRYFAHDDGTPWFGVGHADLDMNWGGFDGDTFSKMAEMVELGENFEMWWPQWASNPLQNSYDDYNTRSMDTIDLVVREAEEQGIAIAFTIWIHQLLRTPDHPWGTGEWGRNGFGKLVDRPEDFFVDDEAWAWQENYYRYVIARWGHSPAIAMWQTITEVNGTNAYEQTDDWHARVDEYFRTHDPYRHPTTATGSGGYWWPAAFEVMDVPQMHVYEQFHANPIEAGEIMADWTTAMWDFQDKPNWIGEYGDRRPAAYPEFSHNANWATLAAGAAAAPVEWNDGYDYGRFDDEQAADQRRFIQFVDELPLVQLAPEQLTVSAEAADVLGWGVGSADGGVIWVQDVTGAARGEDDEEDLDAMRARPPRTDVTLEDDEEDLDAMRARPARTDVTLEVAGLPAGSYTATPYDTWSGVYLDPIPFECAEACTVDLPDFRFDVALRLDPA